MHGQVGVSIHVDGMAGGQRCGQTYAWIDVWLLNYKTVL